MKVVLELTDACNLACDYCYRADYQGKHSRLPTLEPVFKSVDKIINMQPGTDCQIVFFGGEPLIEFHAIKSIINRYEDNPKVTGFSLNTNGTLMTEEITGFIAEAGISVSLAVDGTPEMHNLYRRSNEGAGSHAMVMKSLEHMLSRNISVAARMTIAPSNAAKIREGILYLAGHGVKTLGFAPAVNMEWTRTDIVAWNRSIHDTAQSYFASPDNYPLIFDFEKPASERRSVCSPGRDTITVEKSGKCRPCHRLAPTDRREIIFPEEACKDCIASGSCTKCFPKYGLNRPNSACELKKALIRAVDLVRIDTGTSKGEEYMGKNIVIDGRLYNIPQDVLEKYRLPEDQAKNSDTSGITPISKRTEPPLKGNWYELGEADCY